LKQNVGLNRRTLPLRRSPYNWTGDQFISKLSANSAFYPDRVGQCMSRNPFKSGLRK